MSTKTTLKRIALVAVSALGFGLLSVAPSSAAAAAYRATYTAPTTFSAYTGYSSNTTVGTIQIDLAALGSAGLGIDGANLERATVTIDAVTQAEGFTAAQETASALLLAELTISPDETLSGGTGNYDLAGTGYNRLNNADLSTTALTATATVEEGVGPAPSGATGSVRAYLDLDNGLAAGTYRVKYTLSVGEAEGVIATFTSYLVVTIGNPILGTSVKTPTTASATVASGATGSYTFTQPYTALASTPAFAGSAFTLGAATTVVGASLKVTAAATGGSVTVVPTGANAYSTTITKDGTTGALSVTYTVTVTAPATAENGQIIRVNRDAVSDFTFTIFGGQTWNGTITATRSNSNGGATVGWMGGDDILYASAATSAFYAGRVTVDTGISAGSPSLFPSWTFTMSGVGTFDIADLGVAKAAYAVAPAGAAKSATVDIYSDGRPGTGTLTVTANGNVVATQTVKFYGPAASITVIPFYTIVPSGDGISPAEQGSLNEVAPGLNACKPGANFSPATCFAPATFDTAIALQVVDAAGTPVVATVGTGGISISSSNTAVITNTYDSFLDAGFSNKALGVTTAGTLLTHVTYVVSENAKSGQSATLTFSLVNSLGATISNTQKLTVGGSAKGGTVTMTTDKTTYSPGERMILTVTGKDSSGNPVHDGLSVGSLSSNKNIVGLPSGSYEGGSFVYGDDAGEDLFAPAATGSFDLILYTGTATGASVKVVATVSDDAATSAANAAADAAAEAIDAANAATDAANLAAEAADAATVAAEEARDAADAATAAVEELATQVAALMAALKAQITTLANTVAKIAKKIKA